MAVRSLPVVVIVVLAGSVMAGADQGRLLPSVSRQLDRASVCLDSGRLSEAQAYADLTLLSREIGVSVAGDTFGVSWQALRDWEGALNGQVRFVPAPANLADLTIDYKTTVAMAGRDVVGTATCRRGVREWSGGVFTYHATGSLEVATQSPQGRGLSMAALKQATMHEVGHYLGLDDTPRAGSLMGPIDLFRPVSGPTQAELTVLFDMRALAGSIKDRAVLSAFLPNLTVR